MKGKPAVRSEEKVKRPKKLVDLSQKIDVFE